MRNDGLDLQVGNDRHQLSVRTAANAGEVGWTGDDVVLLAVKSQQTVAALADLLPNLHPGTPVISLQNGVSNERVLLRMNLGNAVDGVPTPVNELVRQTCLALVRDGGEPGSIAAVRLLDRLD